MDVFDQLAKEETITKIVSILKSNNIEASVVNSGAEAKTKVMTMLPVGAEVMTMSSVTLDSIGLTQELKDAKKYKLIRDQLMVMDRVKDHKEMNKLGAVHDFAIGSVHAVTEDGQIMIASNTGSQIPAYAYGAAHVIWVVGTQKIVKDLPMGMRRIFEHSLVLESERVKKAYGWERSNVSKILIVCREIAPGRITVIFVKERLGF